MVGDPLLQSLTIWMWFCINNPNHCYIRNPKKNEYVIEICDPGMRLDKIERSIEKASWRIEERTYKFNIKNDCGFV